MRKWTAALLAFLVLFLSAPPAFASSSSYDTVVDMHGARTYYGSASDWGKTWDKDAFTDITGKDHTFTGDVTIKSGDMGNITVNGSSSELTVKGGTMKAVSCSGKAEVTEGDLESISAGDDLTLKGGNIRHDVYTDEEAKLSGTIKIGGSLEADEITISSNTNLNLIGTMKCKGDITLNQCTLKARKIDGDDSGTLSISKYTDMLPPLENLQKIVVKDSTTAIANGKVEAGELYITEKSEFDASSSVDVDTLTGPGTLYFRSGQLTVDGSIDGEPLLVFSNHVSRGDVAFYADSDTVSPDDVRVYNYGLEAESGSGRQDRFVLTKTISDGITLNRQSLSLKSGASETVKAQVEPNLSKFATGTKVVWDVHGDSSAFSTSVDSSGLSCTVSVSSSHQGMAKATLIAYLEDTHGDRMDDYKSDSCALYTGYSDTPSDNNNSSGSFTLDTTSVSILPGDRYWVLAHTSSSAAPKSISYNSAVATVGAGTAVKDSNGYSAWIYPVTGIGKGQVTIDIGGQKMIANVSNGIKVDTASYTMAPGNKYIIGVEAKGIGAGSIWASSDRSCVSVQYLRKSGKLLLYQICGQSPGTAAVTFSISGGGHVQTAVTVRDGVRAGGTSARLVALA